MASHREARQSIMSAAARSLLPSVYSPLGTMICNCIFSFLFSPMVPKTGPPTAAANAAPASPAGAPATNHHASPAPAGATPSSYVLADLADAADAVEAMAAWTEAADAVIDAAPQDGAAGALSDADRRLLDTLCSPNTFRAFNESLADDTAAKLTPPGNTPGTPLGRKMNKINTLPPRSPLAAKMNTAVQRSPLAAKSNNIAAPKSAVKLPAAALPARRAGVRRHSHAFGGDGDEENTEPSMKRQKVLPASTTNAKNTRKPSRAAAGPGIPKRKAKMHNGAARLALEPGAAAAPLSPVTSAAAAIAAAMAAAPAAPQQQLAPGAEFDFVYVQPNEQMGAAAALWPSSPLPPPLQRLDLTAAALSPSPAPPPLQRLDMTAAPLLPSPAPSAADVVMGEASATPKASPQQQCLGLGKGSTVEGLLLPSPGPSAADAVMAEASAAPAPSPQQQQQQSPGAAAAAGAEVVGGAMAVADPKEQQQQQAPASPVYRRTRSHAKAAALPGAAAASAAPLPRPAPAGTKRQRAPEESAPAAPPAKKANKAKGRRDASAARRCTAPAAAGGSPPVATRTRASTRARQ